MVFPPERNWRLPQLFAGTLLVSCSLRVPIQSVAVLEAFEQVDWVAHPLALTVILLRAAFPIASLGWSLLPLEVRRRCILDRVNVDVILSLILSLTLCPECV